MRFKNIVYYFIALLMMGFGIALYLKAGIGVGAWDVLHSNLSYVMPTITLGTWVFSLSVGTWVFLIGIVTVTISLIFKFTFRSYLAIISSLINGKFIDFFSSILEYEIFNIPTNIYLQLIIFSIALLFLGSGISLLVLTKLPPTPPDILMLSLVHRFKLNYTVSKTMTEVMVLIIAIIVSIMGGHPFYNIGIGTILTTMFVGMIVGYTSKQWRKLLKMDVDK
ncbi:MAG: hypothetical protein K0Q49_120 [Haloplasmataceae bacterium]|jgi:uncharacterized membrane protein YczE|nr:hypothetical protein [Haloplasmataceae bacterium]